MSAEPTAGLPTAGADAIRAVVGFEDLIEPVAQAFAAYGRKEGESPVALLRDDHHLSDVRTAAAGALATRLLARPDSTTVGVSEPESSPTSKCWPPLPSAPSQRYGSGDAGPSPRDASPRRFVGACPKSSSRRWTQRAKPVPALTF